MKKSEDIYMVRKTLMLWGDKEYFNGGFGEIHSMGNTYEDSIKIVNDLTIELLRKDPFICKNLNHFGKVKDAFGNSDFSIQDNYGVISNFFLKEFGIQDDDIYKIPSSASDLQILKLANLFDAPFFSSIKKEDKNFYVNYLNKDFWKEENVRKWSKDFTCIEFDKKVVYNNYYDAKKDGLKRMLLHVNYYKYIKEYLQEGLPAALKNQFFDSIRDYCNKNIGYHEFYSELPNDFFSHDFNNLYQILSFFTEAVEPIITIEVPLEIATFYNFNYKTEESGYQFSESYKPLIPSRKIHDFWYVSDSDKPDLY